MSRGFPSANINVHLLEDPKVRRLWRRLGDPAAMATALTVHLAVVLASWREGDRVTVEEAVPDWLPLTAETTQALQSVGLLDRQLRIPRRSWEAWYVPAFDRREARREAGRMGGLAKAQHHPSNAVASVKRRSTRSVPIRTEKRTLESPHSVMTPLRDAMVAAGLHPDIAKGDG